MRKALAASLERKCQASKIFLPKSCIIVLQTFVKWSFSGSICIVFQQQEKIPTDEKNHKIYISSTVNPNLIPVDATDFHCCALLCPSPSTCSFEASEDLPIEIAFSSVSLSPLSTVWSRILNMNLLNTYTTHDFTFFFSNVQQTFFSRLAEAVTYISYSCLNLLQFSDLFIKTQCTRFVKAAHVLTHTSHTMSK